MRTFVREGSQSPYTFVYTAQGMVDTLTLPSTMVVDYAYDGQNRVTNIVEKVNSVSTPLATFGYTYDRSGNTMSATEVINSTTRNLAYTYDNAHRLLTEAINGVTTTFAYDDAGNRISEVTGATSTTLNYNNMNRLTTRVTGTTTITYGYDARGNMTQAQSKTGAATNYTYTYAYNSRDLLTSANTGTPNTYVYDHDHDGRRTQETANGTVTKFIWDQLSAFGDVVLEQNNTNVTSASYVYAAGRLLSQTKAATLSYLLPDVQGSTRLLINNANSVLQNFDYRAFGEMINAPATPLTRYLYTAQQFDNTTKLYSLRARMYDPSIARFLSMDDYPYNFQNPMELNRYVYVSNNPMMWTDPSEWTNLTEVSKINTHVANTYRYSAREFGYSIIEGGVAGVVGYFAGAWIYSMIREVLEVDRVRGDYVSGQDIHERFMSVINPMDIWVNLIGGAALGATNYMIGQGVKEHFFVKFGALTATQIASMRRSLALLYSSYGYIQSSVLTIMSTNAAGKSMETFKFVTSTFIYSIGNITSITSTLSQMSRFVSVAYLATMNTVANLLVSLNSDIDYP